MARFRDATTVERIKPDATKGASGRVDTANPNNWETYIERLGEVLTIGGREVMHAEQPVGDATHRVTFRLDPETQAITQAMRVKTRGITLNITRKVTIGNPPRLVELMCVSR